MRLGAHESIAGGLVNAFARADADGCAALQIFTTSGRAWAAPARDPSEIAEFAAEARRRRMPVLAHASYLINLAAPRGDLQRRSKAAFVAELERSEALGVGAVVMHPGAHVGAGVAVGLRRVAAAVRWALARTAGYRVRVLLELTAGQGSCLGCTFEQLRALLDAIDEPLRVGVCLDTQHALAAGYEWRTPAAYEAMWREFDRVIGLRRLAAFHLNDSKVDLGGRADRHAPIGAGHIGVSPFRRLVADPRFRDLPAVVELPPTHIRKSLQILRGRS